MSNSTDEQPVSPGEKRSLSETGDRGSPGDDPTVGAEGRRRAAAQPLPLDVVFGLLKNYRRRLVLRYIHAESDTSTLSELAEYVAAIENDKDVDALSSSERKRVYVGLYQGHLPRLDETDVIDFDADRGTVVAAENADYLLEYLDWDDAPSRDWPRTYLAILLAGGGVFLLQRTLFSSGVLSAILVGVLLGVIGSLAVVNR